MSVQPRSQEIACYLVLTHPRKGLMDVLQTEDGRYETWCYANARTLTEWARLGWAPAGKIS